MKRQFYTCLILLGSFILFRCAALTEISQKQIIKGPEFTPYEGLKTSIAVLDFQNHTDRGGDKIGSAVADMLVTLLVRSGRFVVVERQHIQQILQEQALGQSGVITDETATQVGQLLGVQSLIMGDILEATEETGSHKIKDDEDKDNWKLALKATVGHVKFHYRIIDTSTGEIIYADDVAATQIRPGFGIKTKEFDFVDMFEFDQTILGIATRKAINKMVTDIVHSKKRIKWIGKVVQAKEDNVIYITPGKNSGVQIGALFTIFRKTSDSDDELKTLALIEKGTVKVVDFVGERVAKAIIIEGGPVDRGDIVKEINTKP